LRRNSRSIPGINIQWPWSVLLVSGQKTVETRSYPIPGHYIGVELAVIETPGPHGMREAGIDKARIIGTIVFDGFFQYQTKDTWMRDIKRHCVPADDHLFAFRDGEPKWGWTVAKVTSFAVPMPAPSPRGIVFAKECRLA
jgi:hypothetical protein